MLTPVLQFISAGLNRALRMDPASPQRLQALANKCMGLQVAGLGFPVYFSCDGESLTIALQASGEVDVHLSGTPVQMLQAVFSKDLPRDIAVEGDTQVAGAMQALFKKLDIDWEEQVAQLFGDSAARQVGNIVRDARFQAQRAGQTGTEHVKEWLHESLASVPYRFEVDAFVAQVADVRGDVDRLAQRVRRLQDKLKEIGG